MAEVKGESSEEAPRRNYMDDPGIVWRSGKPDFTAVHKAYLEGRTKKHKVGSLEQIVEDLVKDWEMEASHKIRTEVKKCMSRLKENFFFSLLVFLLLFCVLCK